MGISFKDDGRKQCRIYRHFNAREIKRRQRVKGKVADKE